MKNLLKTVGTLLLTTFVILNGISPITAQAANRVQPVDDELVIVIDPGHGGKNLGTQSGHTMEKEMTMITAMAMYEELLKYDDITVYMTHTEDVDLDLKQRAEFAASVNADFLYSIHYNASENHTMFGTEVWISCEKPFNAYGYQFGYLHMEHMADMGLFVRGVKNRQNEEKTDYYGIIRESAALSIPAVIIEHCYVDEERDAEYVENAEDFKAFGRADALSVAKYFGLKSTELGVDYSDVELQPAEADKLVQYTLPDDTRPDVCEIEMIGCDYETGEVTLTVRAADYDSTLIYYSYSIDGGATWSRQEVWPGSNTLTGAYTDTFQLNLKIPEGKRPNIIVRAVNLFDLEKWSNPLNFDQAFTSSSENNEPVAQVYTETPDTTDVANQEKVPATEPVEHPHNSIGTTTFMPVYEAEAETAENVGILTFLKLCLALVIILFLVVLTSQAIHYHKRRKRRQKK